MSESDWLAAARDHLWLPYTQMATAPASLPVVAASGVRLHLADGSELIDGISSWWTVCHGYRHPHVVAAVEAQLAQLPHVMFAGLVHAPAARLAARLTAHLPGDLERVFFTESGSVSVEVAMKMAMQYWRNRGRPQRQRIAYFRHGYHGDTFATMALCDPADGLHSHFGGNLPAQPQLPLPVDAATTAALDAQLAAQANVMAAVIVEPRVQGAGGMKFHDDATLRRIAAACARHDVLLICDEIMTGFGRTGAMFASAAAGIVPDIVCLSKALSGGTLPLAATVARRHVFDAFLGDDPGMALMHGPTYMANPLACAAANASLDLFEREPRLEQVARIEAGLRDGLAHCAALPGVADVRVMGAIGVVELAGPIDLRRLRMRFPELGVWVRPFANVAYLMPPFVIDDADLATLCRAMRTVLAERADTLAHEPSPARRAVDGA